MDDMPGLTTPNASERYLQGIVGRHQWLSEGVMPSPLEFDDFLDHAADLLSDFDTVPAIWGKLFAVLRQRQQVTSDTAWHGSLRDHKLATMLHDEPATAWSFRKPRGYSGDAHLIDFLYEHPAAAPDLNAASPLGRALNAMVVSSSASVAVQERRRLLASYLDMAAERVPNAEALVLACGHLRELELTRSADRLARLMALDQDPVSVAEMRRCYSGMASLCPVEASIGRMIVRPLVHGRFDLIYAAGLYDYLDDTTAERLTLGMMSALKPGGRLLFANFCRDVVDYGYMDAMMDWRLIPRDEPEMQRLVDRLPAADLANITMFRGLNRTVVYVLVEKRG